MPASQAAGREGLDARKLPPWHGMQVRSAMSRPAPGGYSSSYGR